MTGWRRYLPLWGGAVGAGLAIGILPAVWNSYGEPPLAASASTIAPETMPVSDPTEADREWARRGIDDDNGPTEAATSNTPRIAFTFCHSGGGTNCVVDGDTIWLAGQNIRIADIDAPETHEYRCPQEKALGDRATRRLIALVNGGTVSLEGIGRDQDVYGRKLRLVMVDGRSVGDILVDEGLARYYEGGKRSWC